MARTVAQILSQITAQKITEPSLNGLNSPSKVAIYNLWMYITAVSIALFEQVLDIYQAFIETLIGKAGVGTLPWIRDRILEFQSGYNVTYSGGSVKYSTIDTTAQIITRCSPTQGANKTVNIKVAKGEPPQALSGGELSELQFYGSKISFAGTQLNITSGNADFLYVLADIYYDGQLSITQIQTNVVAAMNAYCQGLSTVDNFDGSIIIPAIEVALLGATGVKYIKINEIASRPASSSFASRTILYSLSSGIDNPKTSTVSGYLVGETDTGHTFNDSFTYIPAA
jgi:hypothetical protein